MAFRPRARADSSPSAVATLLMTTAISACSSPDTIRSAIASKLEPRPERRMPSLRLAGWILMRRLFFQGGFPQIELPVSGFGIRHCIYKIDRILARITCGAEFTAFAAEGANKARQAEIAQRIGFNILADLLNGMTRRDQFFFRRSVDAIKARRQRGRAADPHVHFLGSGSAYHLDEIQLHFDSEMPDFGFRLYECTANVMVSDQPEREWDSGLLRVTNGGRYS